MFDYLEQGTGSVPVAEKVAKEVMSLPMSAWVKDEDMQAVVESLSARI